jgi:mannose-1-phosphate guanylyltransferase
MKGLILAAGEGQRLRPLTLTRPKPMLPVAGRPLLEHIVMLLRHHGVTQLAINLHYKPETITTYFGSGQRWGVRILYSYEQQLLGSAGAAKKLAWFFDQTFVVFYGDLYTELNLRPLIAFHRRHGALATVALYEVSNPTACGIVELDQQQCIQRFVEKPAPEEVFSNLANAGVYILEPAALSFVPPNTPFDFGRDLFPALLDLGLPVMGFPVQEPLIDIGTWEKYLALQQAYGAQAEAAVANTTSGLPTKGTKREDIGCRGIGTQQLMKGQLANDNEFVQCII